MKTFKTLILEIGNTHYPFKDRSDYDDTTDASFSSDRGHRYSAFIHNYSKNQLGPHTADLNFEALSPGEGNEGTDLLNTEKNSSHKIFGTVKKIIQHHLNKNPNITHVAFTAAKEDSGRNKLYHHLSRHLDPDYHHEDKKDFTEFHVNISKLKDK